MGADAASVIDALVAEGGLGRSVVFDADGTLWRGDIGEDFLRALGQQQALGPASAGVYARYEELVAREPAQAYAFAVEVMAGFLESDLMARARAFFAQRFAGRVFRFVRPLLHRLREARFELWVCSASPKWLVMAGAEALGVPPDHVVAVDAEVIDGRLSSHVLQPVTCGAGKVTWLRRRGVSPALAFGNGDLDLDMLVAAERAIVVAPLDGPDNHLVAEAHARGWPILRA